MTEQEIESVAGSVVDPDVDYISMRENFLLQAIMYLVLAESGGVVDDPMQKCQQILRETITKAESRSIGRVAGNPVWVLLSRIADARSSYTLSPEGWALWLAASNPPGILHRTIPGLLTKLNMLSPV